MRFPIALLLLIAATPASAGLRVTYGATGQARPLIVEVADNGDARIGEAGAADYGLLTGGHFYVIGQHDGVSEVARIEDIAAAIDQATTPILGDALTRTGPPAPKAKMRFEAKGKRRIAARDGVVYKVYGLDQTDPDATVDYVMSKDRDLAPAGRALELYMHASLLPGAVMLGSAARELIEETRAIFALGTPLDAGGRFQLQGVTRTDLAQERFELPATPATVQAMVAQMKAAAPTN